MPPTDTLPECSTPRVRTTLCRPFLNVLFLGKVDEFLKLPRESPHRYRAHCNIGSPENNILFASTALRPATGIKWENSSGILGVEIMAPVVPPSFILYNKYHKFIPRSLGGGGGVDMEGSMGDAVYIDTRHPETARE